MAYSMRADDDPPERRLAGLLIGSPKGLPRVVPKASSVFEDVDRAGNHPAL